MDENGLRYLLQNRLKGKKIKNLLWLDIEAWVIWFYGWIPGNIGFLVRTVIYKCLFKKLTGFSFIQIGVRMIETRKITIGRNFSVNSGTYLNGIGGITIGDNVLIGPNAVISSGEHPTFLLETPILFQEPQGKRIAIGSGVWIGANAVITPGVTIGEGAVIAANAVVTKSVGKNEVWGGVPALFIKYRAEIG
jgi:acetyltransferase-like isoleucine patch superfamily enzyme